MSLGWVKLHRDIADHWLWSSEPFSKGQAWVDLLLKANHAEHKVMLKGKLYRLTRGQQCRSMLTLSKDWNWSRGKVKRFLDLLESEKMIEVKTDTNTSIITICNYCCFQDDGTTDSTTLDTTDEHQTDNRQDTNKNVKNVKNKDLNVPAEPEQPAKGKRYSYKPNDLNFAIEMFKAIQTVIPDAKQPNYEAWANTIRLMREQDSRKLNQAWEVFAWANKDSFWYKNILSPEKLRKHFDKLQADSNENRYSRKPTSEDERNRELLERYGHTTAPGERDSAKIINPGLDKHEIQRGFSGEMESQGITYNMDSGDLDTDD